MRAYQALKREAVEQGCADCGHEWLAKPMASGVLPSEWPDFLEADHVRGTKTASLSALVRQKGSTIEQVLAEAAKCEWVCLECHRIRTVIRRRR